MAHLKMHRGEKFQRWDMMAQHIVMMSCCNPPVLIQSSKYTRWYVPWGNVFLLTRFKVEKNAILDGCSTVSVKWDGIGCLWLEWGMEHPIFSADYCCYAKKKVSIGWNFLAIRGKCNIVSTFFSLLSTSGRICNTWWFGNDWLAHLCPLTACYSPEPRVKLLLETKMNSCWGSVLLSK